MAYPGDNYSSTKLVLRTSGYPLEDTERPDVSTLPLATTITPLGERSLVSWCRLDSSFVEDSAKFQVKDTSNFMVFD